MEYIMTQTILAFRLLSGDEVISIIASETDTTYELENPAQIATQMTESGKIGLMIAAFQPYAESNITLNKHAIASICTPAQGLGNEYKSKFEESLIITPPTQKIIV
jgi:hypothetical protein